MRFTHLAIAFAVLAIETPICYSTHVEVDPTLSEGEKFLLLPLDVQKLLFRRDRSEILNKLGLAKLNVPLDTMITVLNDLNDDEVDEFFLEFAKLAFDDHSRWGGMCRFILTSGTSKEDVIAKMKRVIGIYSKEV